MFGNVYLQTIQYNCLNLQNWGVRYTLVASLLLTNWSNSIVHNINKRFLTF